MSKEESPKRSSSKGQINLDDSPYGQGKRELNRLKYV